MGCATQGSYLVPLATTIGMAAVRTPRVAVVFEGDCPVVCPADFDETAVPGQQDSLLGVRLFTGSRSRRPRSAIAVS